MGAHALGMGLFEKKLRWLEDEEWAACGYEIEKSNRKVKLSRKSLNRFDEDEEEIDEAIEIVEKMDELKNNEDIVLEIIQEIRNKYSDLMPDDIAIMFLENNDNNYAFASKLAYKIEKTLGWESDIGYETKSKNPNKVFISNRNNVKGLEFPFVICVMNTPLTENYHDRNAIYMMLTRSFIKSFIILPEINKYRDEVLKGICTVNKEKILLTDEPTEAEKATLKKTIIERTHLVKSQHEIIYEIFDELAIMPEQRKKIYNAVVSICKDNETKEEIVEKVKTIKMMV